MRRIERRARHAFVAVGPIAAVLVAAAADVRAQRPEARSFSRIPDAAGLSHQTVHAVLQDRIGFLWVGTADGLNRFDGYTFTEYRRDARQGGRPTENLVWDLAEGPDGTLWVATGGGLLRYDRAHDRFDRVPGPYDEGGLEVYPTRLHVSPRSLLVGTPLGVLELRGDTLLPHPIPGREHARVRDFAESPSGSTWALLMGGEVVDVETGALRGVIESTFRFAVDDAGSWIPGGRDVTDTAGSPASIWAVTRTRDGEVWVGTDRGLARASPTGDVGAPEPLSGDPGSGYVANFVRALVEDRSGTLWVGTHGGLFRHDPHAKPFHRSRADPGAPASLGNGAVSALWTAGDTVWVGTLGGGLNLIVGGDTTLRLRRGTAPGSLPGDVIWAIHRDRAGRVWAGTASGLARVEPDGRVRRVDSAPSAVAIYAIEEAADGRLWVLAVDGLREVAPAEGRLGPPVCCAPPGEPRLVLQGLAVDPSGAVWLGESSAGLIRFDPVAGEMRRFPLATEGEGAQGSLAVWDVHRAGDGALYLGLGTGLGRFDPASGRFHRYGTEDGLAGGVVYSVEEGDDGALWLGTNRGLTRFEPASHGGRFRTYAARDGTGIVEFNRRAAFRDSGGVLSFGGMGGFVRFDPSTIRDNPIAPPIAFTSIETSGSRGTQAHGLPPDGRLELLPHEATVSLEFSALSFTSPQLNRYRYRLQGVDDDWVEAGERRYARYAGLRPGQYRFTVLGSNEDGLWNEEGRSLVIDVPPPFWGTLWFRGLVVTLLVGLVLAAYRARVGHLLEMERMRVRIAGDLHDDIASDLSGIALIGESLQRSGRLDTRDRVRLERLTETARRLVGDVRDIVWSVDPGHDRKADLTHHLREVAGGILDAFTFEVGGDTALGGVLSMNTRRQILLLFKEALHNAQRHAGADSVDIALQWGPGSLELTVEDDGVGFDENALAHRFGLDQMRRRAEAIGGSVRIESRPGHGTRVVLRVPTDSPS